MTPLGAVFVILQCVWDFEATPFGAPVWIEGPPVTGGGGRAPYALYGLRAGILKAAGEWSVTMRAVVTVIGKDMVGILAKVSTACAEYNANVIEVTQSVLQDLFAMIMLVDISGMKGELSEMSDAMHKIGDGMGLSIHVMHENIFNSMHRI